MTAEQAVKALISYGIRTGLIEKADSHWAANSIYHLIGIEPESDFDPAGGEEAELEDILAVLLDDAAARGRIDSGIASRDLFDTEIMGCLTPRPSEVQRTFNRLYEESPEKATDYFYKLSGDSDYIRRYRIRKDIKWTAKTAYGDLDITINLSKPEKDPKAIAAALTKKQNSYPKCLLCRENEGYAGRLDHPARENLRLIPLTLDGEDWYLQYSPYVYYNEHCIVFSGKHVPMKISRATFARLLEFITRFSHYTVGSNADLPIVGGSILTHEHFQGGNYIFPMARAGIRESLSFKGFEDIEAGIVDWSMSVIRLTGSDPDRIIELADRILTSWRGYSDASCGILAETDGTPHNTITPIARRRGERFELDLVLRNNRTTEEYPLGIYHPHNEYHHIKKENIGLIEVMGLAVLPARLKGEMELLEKTILEGKSVRSEASLEAHADWADEILRAHPEFAPAALAGLEDKTEIAAALDRVIKDEIGIVFSNVLENCGVFKDTEEGAEGFRRFASQVL
ncbi:MAG: UDP-glucose--hexose-1-phosphate uridylyltransferase [Lachnospiraceae bacterium]|nr:UDP-glucose--hexose-1-phosphate uridylyltransferase [Lachnospiraceae bacterium]